jgi:hypothetical protein
VRLVNGRLVVLVNRVRMRSLNPWKMKPKNL